MVETEKRGKKIIISCDVCNAERTVKVIEGKKSVRKISKADEERFRQVHSNCVPDVDDDEDENIPDTDDFVDDFQVISSIMGKRFNPFAHKN